MTFFFQAFVTLFVIIDPPGIVPVFLGLTRGRPVRTRRRLAWQAAIVAFAVIVAFALFGREILAYTQVQIAALEGAGGLLLLLVSLQLLTGKTDEPTSVERAKSNVAFVPLGTPLLAGPGAIVATMLFVQRVNTLLEGAALALAILAVAVCAWAVMRFAAVIHRVLTDNGVELLTRIAGLLLAAIAVQLVAQSALAFAAQAPLPGARPGHAKVAGGTLWVGARDGRVQAEVRVVEARVERVLADLGEGQGSAWLIGDDEEVIVIDPGEDAEAVLSQVGDREILAVICTHGHASHIAAAVGVAERDEAAVALHRSDLLLWRMAHDGAEAEIEMADGGRFDVADVQLEVVHTPGHTPGSVSLYCAELEVVFTGDALAAGGPVPHEGAFPDFARQLTAIGERLLDLPSRTRVLPGHGEEFTVGDAAKRFDGWVSAGPGDFS